MGLKTDFMGKKHLRCAAVSLALLLPCGLAYADSCAEDSTGDIVKDSVIMYADKIPVAAKSRTDGIAAGRWQTAWTGMPLVAAGLVVKSEDDRFRSLRNDYMPRFSNHTDDYMQYVPAAVMLGLKAAGVEGRSSWNRMLVSDAFGFLIMAGVVNMLKTTTRVTRPDGSDRHSFPSGHTATAFMTATMLTKEYGYRSPWVGIGAYTAASATGLMRMANNKHWLSDVLTGAGVGILSTEIGYLLSDVLFRDRGLNKVADAPLPDKAAPPSFVSLYIGMNVPMSKYDIDEGNTFRTSSGSSVGLEGAYFLNPYVGAGGRIAVSNTSLVVNGDKAEDNTFDAVSVCGGCYLSYPLSRRWRVGSKLLGGYVYYPQLELSGVTIGSRSGICLGSGLSCTFKVNGYYGMRFFADYNLQPSHSRGSKEWMNTLTYGVSFSVHL